MSTLHLSYFAINLRLQCVHYSTLYTKSQYDAYVSTPKNQPSRLFLVYARNCKLNYIFDGISIPNKSKARANTKSAQETIHNLAERSTSAADEIGTFS